jgi:hypothetical protein
MDEDANLFPLQEEVARLTKDCKLKLHSGECDNVHQNDPSDPGWQLFAAFQQARQEDVELEPQRPFRASFVVPVSGDCLIFLHSPDDQCPSQNLGRNLTIRGTSPDGCFVATCPQFYVSATSDSGVHPAWVIASPVNGPMQIEYGEPRQLDRVEAIINNFDPARGNTSDQILRVEADGRTVDFNWRPRRSHLRTMLDAGVLRSAALTSFSFRAWDGAGEADLLSMAYNVASLCSVATRQQTGIPVITLLDSCGRVVKRVIPQPVESDFHTQHSLRFLSSDEFGLPRLFRECFTEFAQMQRSELWRRMPPLIASLEDQPFLDQKVACLMAALERLIRNCLIENDETEIQATNFTELIAAARGALRWDIPKHYTSRERHRELSNATRHGDDLPFSSDIVRNDFDKWRLFLTRRYLMRLGYRGPVSSPRQGWASTSPVDDFTEENNSFSRR